MDESALDAFGDQLHLRLYSRAELALRASGNATARTEVVDEGLVLVTDPEQAAESFPTPVGCPVRRLTWPN